MTEIVLAVAQPHDPKCPSCQSEMPFSLIKKLRTWLPVNITRFSHLFILKNLAQFQRLTPFPDSLGAGRHRSTVSKASFSYLFTRNPQCCLSFIGPFMPSCGGMYMSNYTFFLTFFHGSSRITKTRFLAYKGNTKIPSSSKGSRSAQAGYSLTLHTEQFMFLSPSLSLFWKKPPPNRPKKTYSQTKQELPFAKDISLQHIPLPLPAQNQKRFSIFYIANATFMFVDIAFICGFVSQELGKKKSTTKPKTQREKFALLILPATKFQNVTTKNPR